MGYAGLFSSFPFFILLEARFEAAHVVVRKKVGTFSVGSTDTSICTFLGSGSLVHIEQGQLASFENYLSRTHIMGWCIMPHAHELYIFGGTRPKRAKIVSSREKCPLLLRLKDQMEVIQSDTLSAHQPISEKACSFMGLVWPPNPPQSVIFSLLVPSQSYTAKPRWSTAVSRVSE